MPRRQKLAGWIVFCILVLIVSTPVNSTVSKWTSTADLCFIRQDHMATLLKNNQVLIVGWDSNKAEMYNPATGVFTVTGTTTQPHRQGATATLLNDGRVLIVGGFNGQKTAELYDPETGLFTPTGVPNAVHCYHTATLLADGRVLISAGQDQNGPQTHATAEIYNPMTGTFTLTGDLQQHRSCHSANLLANGQVLITGGLQTTIPGATNYLKSCELYDPATGSFALLENMKQTRYSHTATLLSNGKVLVAGGAWFAGYAELYDSNSKTWTVTGNMSAKKRINHSATLLANDRVLLAGGLVNTSSRSAEIYDPETNTFTLTDSMLTPRSSHRATTLADGSVLVTGGFDGINTIALAEKYDDPTSTGMGAMRTLKQKPEEFMLLQNYPNPFNSETRLHYKLSNFGKVCIAVYNLRGEWIRTLINADKNAGEYDLSWNGTSDNGKPVAGGMYLVLMTAGKTASCRKVLYLK